MRERRSKSGDATTTKRGRTARCSDRRPSSTQTAAEDWHNRWTEAGGRSVHERVYGTVEVFSSAILRAIKEEEAKADVWFVIVPDELFKYCRPESEVEAGRKIIPPGSWGKRSRGNPRQTHLFAEDRELAKAYDFQPDFHTHLKPRL